MNDEYLCFVFTAVQWTAELTVRPASHPSSLIPLWPPEDKREQVTLTDQME